MASFTGQTGALSIGGNAVSELRSWSIDATMATIEASKMGDTTRVYKKSLIDWTGSADIYLDSGAFTNVTTALTTGTPVAIIAYPSSSGSGAASISGNIILTGHSINTSFDGMVEATISFQGTGNITYAQGT